MMDWIDRSADVMLTLTAITLTLAVVVRILKWAGVI